VEYDPVAVTTISPSKSPSKVSGLSPFDGFKGTAKTTQIQATAQAGER
jgi:hypothetical protein